MCKASSRPRREDQPVRQLDRRLAWPRLTQRRPLKLAEPTRHQAEQAVARGRRLEVGGIDHRQLAARHEFEECCQAKRSGQLVVRNREGDTRRFRRSGRNKRQLSREPVGPESFLDHVLRREVNDEGRGPSATGWPPEDAIRGLALDLESKEFQLTYEKVLCPPNWDQRASHGRGSLELLQGPAWAC
jgi:hypothetical protein